MALFKIFKGNDSNKLTKPNATGYLTPTDGYAYYDTSTKLFYIDAAYPEATGITRQPINAAKAGIAGTALNGIFYGTCTTAQSTKAKVAIIEDSLGFVLQTGTIVVIKFTNASAASTMTLTLQDKNNNTIGSAHNLELYGTTAMSSGTTTSGWRADAAVPFIFDGANWIRFFWENTTYYYTSAYCTTGATTAAKVGTYSGVQTLTGSKYFQIWIQNTNTATSALTLNMNSLGAKKIYLNGQPTSNTNYNLLRGCYLVYYDANGDNGNGCYHFRTDNKIPGNLAGNADTATQATLDGSGNNIVNTYLTKTAGVTNIVWDSTNKKITKTINGSTSDVVTLATLLNSAALTGTPTAPTAATGTNTTQIATTAFVNAAITNAVPQNLGHTLTIGTYSFDGSEDVTIPIYDGTIS